MAKKQTRKAYIALLEAENKKLGKSIENLMGWNGEEQKLEEEIVQQFNRDFENFIWFDTIDPKMTLIAVPESQICYTSPKYADKNI